MFNSTEVSLWFFKHVLEDALTCLTLGPQVPLFWISGVVWVQ